MLKDLDKKAIIRLVIFTLLMGWCVFVSVFFSKGITFIYENYVPNIDIDTIFVQVIGIIFLIYYILLDCLGLDAESGVDNILYLSLLLVVLLVEVIFTMLPTILVRNIGIKSTKVISEDEYKLTNYIYWFAIMISFILGLIMTECSHIISVAVITGVWALAAHKYVHDVKSRSKNLSVG